MSDIHLTIDFREWSLDRYYATSPCRKMSFWVANGFLLFRDEDPGHCHNIVGCLETMSCLERRRVWRAYKAEVRRRAVEMTLKAADASLAKDIDAVLRGANQR